MCGRVACRVTRDLRLSAVARHRSRVARTGCAVTRATCAVAPPGRTERRSRLSRGEPRNCAEVTPQTPAQSQIRWAREVTARSVRRCLQGHCHASLSRGTLRSSSHLFPALQYRQSHSAHLVSRTKAQDRLRDRSPARTGDERDRANFIHGRSSRAHFPRPLRGLGFALS